jgi:hypothetical protein
MPSTTREIDVKTSRASTEHCQISGSFKSCGVMTKIEYLTLYIWMVSVGIECANNTMRADNILQLLDGDIARRKHQQHVQRLMQPTTVSQANEK